MRICLTILSILLLPQTSAHSWSNIFTRLSSYSIVSPKQYLDVESAVLPLGTSDETLRELRGRMGSTLYAVTVDVYDRWNDTEIHFKEALFNGFLCEFSGDYEDEITRLLYGDTTVELSNAQRSQEEKQALGSPIYFNCTTLPGDDEYDDCFCSEETILLFCLIRRLERRIRDSGDRDFDLLNPKHYNAKGIVIDIYKKKKCLGEALDSLAEHKPLSNIFVNNDFGTFGRTLDKLFDGNDTIDHVTMNLSTEMAQLLCQATDPEASEAVKSVFASDAYYPILEHQLYTVWGPARMDVNAACKNGDRFSTSNFGKCVCARDRGFSFCIWKVLGEYFKKKGYLSCAPDNEHFVSAKKPARTPALAEIGAPLVPVTTTVVPKEKGRHSFVRKRTTTSASITNSRPQPTIETTPFTIPNNSRKQEKKWITLITLLMLIQHLLKG